MRQYPDIPLEKVRNGKPTWWRVAEPVRCDDTDGSVYLIPRGFVSNFTSMPRFLFVVEPPHGASAIPSVKHDYRYIHLVGAGKDGFRKARRNSDAQYRADLLEAGVRKPIAYLMYYGVRLLGWAWYWKHMIRRLRELI